MKVFSPAKINLFLRILRRREDGYHDLSSLFQAVDLGDTLDLTFSDVDSLETTDPTLPVDRSNLVWKAVDLFRKKTGKVTPLKIHLDKKIPMQAGVGGGSSNASATLWALNVLHETNVSDLILATWASEIGSDISFFFSSGRAHCTGRGEIVKSLKPLEMHPTLWLVKPPGGLSTPAVYKALDLSKCSRADPEEILKRHLAREIVFINDLELPAFIANPSLKQLKEELVSQGYQVSMTGSGTGLMCVGEKKPEVAPGIQVYPLCFIYRDAKSWYQSP